jgi:hypothetical protein
MRLENVARGSLGILLLPFALAVLLIMAVVIGFTAAVDAIRLEFGDW